MAVMFLCSTMFFNTVYGGIKKENVRAFIQSYQEQLALYCECNTDENIGQYKKALLNLHDPSNREGEYAFDLFGDEALEFSDFQSYLQEIKNKYHNEVTVTFDDDQLYIYDCIDRIDNKKIAYATVRKTLRFQSLKRTITLLIALNVTNEEYSIFSVSIPEESNGIYSKCNITHDHYIRDDFSELYLNFGTHFYREKEYITAKEWFEKVLSFQPGNKVASIKIDSCNIHITCDEYLEYARSKMKLEQFSAAKKHCKNMADLCPLLKGNAEDNIKKCDSAINFTKFDFYLNDGNYLYQKGFYTAAVKSFKKALTYLSDDNYCGKMIEKCIEANDTALNTINRAIYDAEQGKKAQAFKTLSYYEESGLLTGENYYFMAMMMNSKDDKVAKQMNYTNAQCRHLAREYCLKAIMKGNVKAKQLWESRMIK